MDQATQQPRQISLLLGGLSFIPLIGVIFGLAAIVIGLSTPRSGGRKLAAIGAGGIAFTFLLYGGLFYFSFVQRGGVYDGLRTKLAQSELDSLVPAIEFYKVQHGSYPENLDALRQSLPKDSTIFIFDPSGVHLGGTSREFYYKRVGVNHYYLRGVGSDSVPFTSDDVVPQIDTSSSGVGLLKDKQGD